MSRRATEKEEEFARKVVARLGLSEEEAERLFVDETVQTILLARATLEQMIEDREMPLEEARNRW